MSHQARYLINFQQHFHRYLRSCFPITVQIVTVLYFSGNEKSSGTPDEALMFVSLHAAEGAEEQTGDGLAGAGRSGEVG